MDSGSIAWMLTCSALVLLMTPGLAFFYGGLVRRKNVVSTIMYSFICMGLVSVIWVLWGYTLSFGEGGGNLIGSLNNFALRGVDSPDDQVFAIFQMMFAIITPALITGAFCERFKFKTYMIFLVLWITFVYAPIAHWVWDSNGWLFKRGALDFAGGAVVHINAGMAAIAAAALVGRRRNIERGVEPHNVPYVILGASILWFGWFGFNAGSGLAADGLAVSAFLVTNTCAATAMMIWVILGMFHGGKVSGVGAATGAIAGLATITPASGFIGVESSLYLGIITGIITFYAVYFKSKVNLDDALDVFAVHGIGGIVGLIGTGIFATNGGLINGSSDLLIENFIMIVSTVAYSLIVSIVILKILDMIPGLGLRSEENEEDQGLDLSDHSERGYVADGAD
ncbi:MAG: ammonium transporter [SAR202 cluster bacterium]|nr:ammonium transporter [SAR202 cluster bacterium]OUU74558.1 MAG: ammonia channel protein [Chloroflexi bacterium TMED70]RZP15043.1 MAG: ammonium transporter [Chloroflexota bacterium]|tara:strand:- start:373 stop:1560 length:1188 start_codon:yes stop_codon:yes gene_type:complete